MAEVTLQRGDQVPRFEVRNLQGDPFSYSTIWQRENLVLVTLPEDVELGNASRLASLTRDFAELETVLVITRDRIAGLPTPGAIVADRWGEIVHVATAPDVNDLPAASELMEWIDYVRIRCPECEGEAK
jgi:hypothetical protein